MEDASIARLNAIPWVSSLVNDPKWTLTHSPPRTVTPSGEHSFFSETIATDRTIRSCLALKPTQKADNDPAYKEVLWIMELGDALNGHVGTLHGGMAALLLDQVCGLIMLFNMEERHKRPEHTGPIQHYMTVCESISGGTA
jgi:thioesterase superfamily protein 4